MRERAALLDAESLDDCLRWANGCAGRLPLVEGLREAEMLVGELGDAGKEAARLALHGQGSERV